HQLDAAVHLRLEPDGVPPLLQASAVQRAKPLLLALACPMQLDDVHRRERLVHRSGDLAFALALLARADPDPAAVERGGDNDCGHGADRDAVRTGSTENITASISATRITPV